MIRRLFSEDDSKQKKRVRKNRKTYPVSPFPRILKRDIRYFLPKMMVNVINSGDISLIFGFLRTYCLPDMIYEAYICGESSTLQRQPVPSYLTGVELLATTIACNLRLSPDAVFQMDSAFIRRQLHQGVMDTEVVVETSGTGHRLYDFESTHDQLGVVEVDELEGGQIDLEKVISKRPLVPLHPPIPIITRCQIIFKMDVDNRIQGLQAISLPVDGAQQCLPVKTVVEGVLGMA